MGEEGKRRVGSSQEIDLHLRDVPASVAIAESGNKILCLIIEATLLSITSYVDQCSTT